LLRALLSTARLALPRGTAAGVALLVAAAFGTPARAGLVINPTFDPSVPAAAQAAFNYAVNEFESRFTNNMTVNINVKFGNTGLGESDSAFEGSFTYAQILGALQAQAAANPGDATKQTIVANLPATNPAPTNNFWMTTANAKALGLDNAAGSDGTIIFSNAVSYTYDPNNRAVPGEFDFIGVAEHEISEVLGRDPGLGTNFGNGPAYVPNDLFRFTNGSRNFTFNQSDPPGVYFSIDGGVTNLVNFYSQGVDNDDYRGDNPTDPFNQFTGTGQAHALNSVDIANLEAFGYTVATVAAPEPTSLTLLGLGVASLAGFRLRRRS
jgi:hypothetical protein